MLTGAPAFEGLELVGRRRERRWRQIAAALEENPELSLPKAVGSDSAVEVAYRLLGSRAFRASTIVDHLSDLAWRNAAGAKAVLAFHDTTQLSFTGSSRDGLSEFSSQRQGFYAHTALLVAAEGVPRAYGVVGCDPYTVRSKKWYRPAGNDEEIELGIGSERWTSLALAVGERKPRGVEVVHVMDREGDCFETLAEWEAAGESVVVRAAHDRAIEESEGRLAALRASEPVIATRDVWIGKRRSSKDNPPKSRAKQAIVRSRSARVEVRIGEVNLTAPRDARVTDRAPLRVSVSPCLRGGVGAARGRDARTLAAPDESSDLQRFRRTRNCGHLPSPLDDRGVLHGAQDGMRGRAAPAREPDQPGDAAGGRDRPAEPALAVAGDPNRSMVGGGERGTTCDHQEEGAAAAWHTSDSTFGHDGDRSDGRTPEAERRARLVDARARLVGAAQPGGGLAGGDGGDVER